MRTILKSAFSALATLSAPAWAQTVSTVWVCKDPKDATTCVPLGTDIIIIHPDLLVVLAGLVVITAFAAIYAAIKISSLSSRR